METAYWSPKNRASQGCRRIAETMKTLKSHDTQFVEKGRRLPDPRLEPGKFGSDMAQAVQDAEP